MTYTNTQAIESKTKVARYTSLAGLAIMLPGLFIAIGGLLNPTLQGGDYILLSYVSLILGMIVATMGGRLAEQWLIEPRNDQRLERALKGLDKRYRLINYHTPADHVLLTPTGLYVIVPKDETGVIHFDGQRWSQPFSLRRLWRDWRHGGLGNPTVEANVQIKKLQAWLKPEGEGADTPVKPLIVFTKPEAELDITEGHDEIMHLKNLKSYLLKHTTPALPSALYRALADAVTPETEAETAEDETEEESAEPAPTAPSSKKSRRKKRKEKKAEEA